MPERPPPRIVVRAVLAARRALLELADRVIPAHIALFQHSIGVARTHAIGTVAELGVADLLAERPATARELAERLGLDADALHRLLRAAVVERMLRMDRAGRFSLTRLSRPLVSDAPYSQRDWARYMALGSTTRAWAALTDSVRSGEPAFPRVHGMSIWEWFAQHPDEEQLFAGAMRRLTEIDAPIVVPAYPWPETGVVCDVAGGVGPLLAAVLRTRPGLRGILVDGPGVLESADRWLSEQRLRERVELAEGDIFERVTATADIYLLKDVLHDWDDERSARILATVRGTMPPGSRLVIVEALQERNRPDPIASLTDVQMLTQCDGGRQRSQSELQSLLLAAGLEPGRVRRTAGPALVEGVAG